MKSKVNIILIAASSILIHCAMLIVKGPWWDDWKFYIFEYSELKSHYITAGRLDAYYIIGLIHNLPECMFRFTVILCYTLSAIFVYIVLMFLFEDSKQAFWVAILYNAIPVNDVRVMRCVFPYTFSHLLFWTATFLLVYMFKINDKKSKLGIRGFSLLLFFISFSTNSLLFFYLIPLAIIWFIEIKRLKYCNNISKGNCKKRFLSYMDYYILPILFYVIKKIWFSPDSNGAFRNYNVVSFSKILIAVKMMYKVILKTGYSILKNWVSVIKAEPFIIIIFLLMFVLFFMKKKHIHDTKGHMSKRNAIIGFFVGLVLFSIGLFPYSVIRTGAGAIDTQGLLGRDSILTSLGMAVMLYYAINIFKMPGWGQYAILSCILLMSFIHFNGWYMLYLGEHYEQIALQQAWLETDYIKDGKTFIYVRPDKGMLQGERFYSLNSLAYQTYGDSTRYFSVGIQDLKYITVHEDKEIFISNFGYAMNQYSLDDIDINGIMVISYNLSNRDCIRLKIKEIFKEKEFLNDIRKYLDYTYIEISEDISDQIYDMYQSEMIATDDELIDFLVDSGCFIGNKK